jgi:hypothetical protein
MQETVRSLPIWTLSTFVGLITIGCTSGDARLVELSRQSADRQAEQNRLVETNNGQVLEATDKLVEADAKSRTENIELHDKSRPNARASISSATPWSKSDDKSLRTAIGIRSSLTRFLRSAD